MDDAVMNEPAVEQRRADPEPEADGAGQPDPQIRVDQDEAPASPGVVGRLVSIGFRVLLVLVLLGIGAAVFGFLAGQRTSPERTEGDVQRLGVLTMSVAPREVTRVWSGYGTARSMQAVDVSSQVTARVTQRPERIEAGQSVRKGEVIVRLDPTDFEQRVEQATRRIQSLEAQLASLDIEERRTKEQAELAVRQTEIAEREYRRAVDAFEDGAGTQNEVEARLTAFMAASRDSAAIAQRSEQIPARRDGIEADLAAQRASLQIEQTDLERTAIVSPIDGVLQDVMAREGERLAPGAVVARVVDLSKIETPVRLPMGAQRDVRIGNSVALRTDGEGQREWTGIVSRIAPEADAATRSFTVFVEVEQRSGAEIIAEEDGRVLLPGQFVIADIRPESTSRRMIAPRRAVSGDRVLVARETEDGWIAKSIAVRVGFAVDGAFPGLHPSETQWLVVEEGLEPSDRLIVSNLDAITDGMPVDVAPVGAQGAGGGE